MTTIIFNQGNGIYYRPAGHRNPKMGEYYIASDGIVKFCNHISQVAELSMRTYTILREVKQVFIESF